MHSDQTLHGNALGFEQSAPPQAQQTLRKFRILFNAVRSHFQQLEQQCGLGGAQIWALSLIEHHPGICVNDLARAMDIQPSTASNLVKSLQLAAYVRSERQTTDKRRVSLATTEAGRAKLQQAPQPYSGVLPKALLQLDHLTLTRLNNDLDTLLKALQVSDQQAAQTPLADL